MDSRFSDIEDKDDVQLDVQQEDNIISHYEAEIALLRRRLSRSEAAKKEAETLLETKSRRLVRLDEQLRQDEENLVRQIDQNTQYLINAQRFHRFKQFF